VRLFIAACEAATGVVPYSDRARNVALAHTVLDMSYNEVGSDESCSAWCTGAHCIILHIV